jgi:hypothetical protein
MSPKPNLSPNDFVKELGEQFAGAGVSDELDGAGTAEEVAAELARSDSVPDLVSFTGYVGATVNRDQRRWLVLYLDVDLNRFLLVDADGVVHRKPIDDKKAPCKKRDVIWVKANAAATIGTYGMARSVEAEFLTGEFTRAADVEETRPTGAALPAATGIFCEARSAACCGYRTHH